MMLNSPLTMGVVSDERAPSYVKQAADIYNKKIKPKNKFREEIERGRYLVTFAIMRDGYNATKVGTFSTDDFMEAMEASNDFHYEHRGERVMVTIFDNQDQVFLPSIR